MAGAQHAVRVALLERLQFAAHSPVFFDGRLEAFSEGRDTLLVVSRPGFARFCHVCRLSAATIAALMPQKLSRMAGDVVFDYFARVLPRNASATACSRRSSRASCWCSSNSIRSIRRSTSCTCRKTFSCSNRETSIALPDSRRSLTRRSSRSVWPLTKNFVSRSYAIVDE